MVQPILQLNSALAEQLAIGEQNVTAGEIDLMLANAQRLAGIGILTTGIAQELADLLSVVTAAIISLRRELQLQDDSSAELTQHYMNLIERNAFRCAQIVTMLQEYGALKTQQMAVTDIATILRDTLVLVERQFREESEIHIEVTAPGMTRSIVCDHNRIIQLLVNLLNNARDSMQDSGGLIEVAVQTIEYGAADGSPAAGNGHDDTGDHIKITILDEGPGILPNLQDHLFLPFFSTRSGSNGVGLGLSIAREIVQQHNGYIRISNSKGPGKGALVTVILPVRPSV